MSNAVAKSNVVSLRTGAFLKELEAELKVAKPWSEEKTHIMYLLAQYLRHSGFAAKRKMEALSLILEYSDLSHALSEAGYQRTVTVSAVEHEMIAHNNGKNKITWATVDVGN